MVALKQGSVPDVIANKLDHLLILTSGTEQYLITCTNKKYKFLLTTTLTISAPFFQKLSLIFTQTIIYHFNQIFAPSVMSGTILFNIGLFFLFSVKNSM